jgi:hypothetical protein
MLDLSKPVQTRDGMEAHVYERFDAQVFGRIKRDGHWFLYWWDDCGKCRNAPGYDLINVPEKRRGWLNIYEAKAEIDGVSNPRESVSHLHESKADADKCASRGRIACVEIEFTAGEGV